MLEGVKILEFAQYYPGPYASLRLQDWGAQVIKIEPPAGDNSRYHEKVGDDEGIAYQVLNRGKPSVVLNLKDEGDLQRARELAQWADVLVEGFRPGVMDRLGLGYEAVKRLNPGIVYCSITGYGQTGSLHTKSGHDLNYLALGGMLSHLTDAQGRPVLPEVALVDTVSGLTASEAMLAGLVKRSLDPNGEGCYLDISMTESIAVLQSLVLAQQERWDKADCNPRNVSYNIYETADGRFVTIAAMEPKFWLNFCRAVERMDLAEAHMSPAEESNPAFGEMVALFKSRSFEEWLDFFYREDCCFAPVLTAREAAEFPLFTERRIVERRWGLTHMKTHYLGEVDLPEYSVPIARLGQNDLQV